MLREQVSQDEDRRGRKQGMVNLVNVPVRSLIVAFNDSGIAVKFDALFDESDV